jgi:hypothetical protein
LAEKEISDFFIRIIIEKNAGLLPGKVFYPFLV